MSSQSFSGPSYRHPAVRAGRVRWWIATVVTAIASIPAIVLAGMLCFSWLVGIGPRMETSSPWMLNVMNWLVTFVTDVSYAFVGWFPAPTGIMVALTFILWATVVAPRIVSSPSVMAYRSQREHGTDSRTLDHWMRDPVAEIQVRARRRYLSDLMMELLSKLIKSAAVGLFTAGLIVGVTAIANATDSGLWGNVAFVAAVIVAFLLYLFVFELLPHVQIEAAAQLQHQREVLSQHSASS